MRFDDRLKTVLNLDPRSNHDRAVRWRQLVELLARVSGPSSALVEQALTDIRSERESIPEQLRAAAARAVAKPQLNPELVAYFAEDKVTVGAPVLAAASLTVEEWRRVLSLASADARKFITTLHPEAAEEAGYAGSAPASRPAEPQTPAEPAAIPSISEVVARFEKLRQAPRPATLPGPTPALARADEPGIFRWECSPAGEIAWVEGAPRGALIGRSLSNPGENNGIDDQVPRAFAMRAPFRDAKLTVAGEGAASGDWKISGVPAFEPVDGRFVGYRGVAVREAGQGSPRAGAGQPSLDSDSLRELVHEVKTPLNAIIGFAEIIDGQYLGPADHAYRERAAQIVAQARLLLAAIEDLDLSARLRSDPEAGRGDSDLADIVAAVVPALQDMASARGATIQLDLVRPNARCSVNSELAERLARRFCSGIIDAAAKGETITIAVDRDNGSCTLAVDRPKGLAGLSFGAAGSEASGELPDSLVGSHFALRLTAALAELCGGSVKAGEKRIVLALPSA